MSLEDEGFFARVYALVRRVPRGRVVTYGQVAAMLGVPRGARAVGWAMRALPEEMASRVPWHRVVGTGGRISPRRGPGPDIQRRRLRAENVSFCGPCVDLDRHGLLAPRIAPSNRARRLGPVPNCPDRPFKLVPERVRVDESPASGSGRGSASSRCQPSAARRS
jgi:methylated-DNA-protein-cysteine methyltransferase-like protein